MTEGRGVDAYLGLFQRRKIVEAVAGHSGYMSAVLQRLDEMEFVLGK